MYNIKQSNTIKNNTHATRNPDKQSESSSQEHLKYKYKKYFFTLRFEKERFHLVLVSILPLTSISAEFERMKERKN